MVPVALNALLHFRGADHVLGGPSALGRLADEGLRDALEVVVPVWVRDLACGGEGGGRS